MTVTKTSEDGVLEGHRFHLFGTSESGLEVNAYAVTDNTGKAYFNDILIGNGYTLQEFNMLFPTAKQPILLGTALQTLLSKMF